MNSDFAIRIWFDGNPGNIIPMYLTALKMQRSLGYGRICNVRVPMFNIDLPDFSLQTAPGGFHDAFEPNNQRNGILPLNGWKKFIHKSDACFLSLEGLYQNVKNFPTRAEVDYDKLFPLLPGLTGGGEDELVINIRGGDILQGICDLYPMIPVEFYKFIANKTQKKVIFHGQLDESPYMDELKENFPDATYLPSMGPAQDFDFIRKSKYIIPSISTFSWMASWLSSAQRIFLPMAGLYNLAHHSIGLLLPIDDPRFEFYSFPLYEATHVNQYRSYIDPVRNAWRFAPNNMLREAIEKRESHLDEYLQAFNIKDFLSMYPDSQHYWDEYGVRGMVNTFVNNWYIEGRKPVHVDRTFYTRTYPDAAIEMAEGKYKNEVEHYVLKGQFQGYKPKHV